MQEKLNPVFKNFNLKAKLIFIVIIDPKILNKPRISSRNIS